MPLILLSDFLNHNASRRHSASGSIPRRYFYTSGHWRGVTRSNSYVRIVFNSDRVPRRKFLNTSISGLLSRSSIRLDSQTFNMIWHNLVTGDHGTSVSAFVVRETGLQQTII